MSDIDFDEFFEPEDESDEDFEFIDPAVFKEFQSVSFSIEKIKKQIFNTEENDNDEINGEKDTRKFEFKLQVNRILQIFDEMIRNIETLLCIQEFVKDRNLMECYFSDADIACLSNCCSNKILTIDLTNEIEKEKIIRMIQLLLSSGLRLHVESYKDKISLQKKMFLSSIKELRTIIDLRLQTTAPKELRKEQILHQMWKQYGKTKEKMAKLREKWIYRKQNFEEKMRDKYETINRYKNEIEVLKKQSEIEIQNRIKESNASIIKFCKLKDDVIEEKDQISEDSAALYKSFLKENLTRETKLREQKEKSIQMLQVILSKYDAEIGEDKTHELNELRNALELQKTEFVLWKETICEPQIRQHAQLMHEREEAERHEMEQAMMIFMMNRSAKILQKYWRNMVAKRKKKKGRRGGKKK